MDDDDLSSCMCRYLESSFLYLLMRQRAVFFQSMRLFLYSQVFPKLNALVDPCQDKQEDLQNANCQLQFANCKLQIANFELQIANAQLRANHHTRHALGLPWLWLTC